MWQRERAMNLLWDSFSPRGGRKAVDVGLGGVWAGGLSA